MRLEDLVKWTVPDFPGWAGSLKAQPLKQSVLRELGTNGRREALHRYRESTLTSGLNFKDVQREKAQLGERGETSFLSRRAINRLIFTARGVGLTSGVWTGLGWSRSSTSPEGRPEVKRARLRWSRRGPPVDLLQRVRLRPQSAAA